jgi:hypothetical protein
MPDDLDDKILENAQKPAKAAGDAGSVDQHPLSEQLAVSKHFAAKEAVKQKNRGLKFNKLSPPGTA